MKPVKGYTALTSIGYTDELIWRVELPDGSVVPEIYETAEEVYGAIIEDVEEDIRQFHDGEKDWDDIHWGSEYKVVWIEINENENMSIYDAPDTGIGSRIILIKQTLNEWRNGL